MKPRTRVATAPWRFVPPRSGVHPCCVSEHLGEPDKDPHPPPEPPPCPGNRGRFNDSCCTRFRLRPTLLDKRGWRIAWVQRVVATSHDWGVAMAKSRRRLSDRALRPPIRSPARPPDWRPRVTGSCKALNKIGPSISLPARGPPVRGRAPEEAKICARAGCAFLAFHYLVSIARRASSPSVLPRKQGRRIQRSVRSRARARAPSTL